MTDMGSDSAGASSLRPLADARVDDAVIWSMIDAAPDGTLLCDRDGTILLANSQVEVLFGYDRADLLGQGVDCLLPEALRGVHRAHRLRYTAAPEVRAMGKDRRLMARRKDGTEFAVEIALSPVHAGGSRFTIATVRDITERLELESAARDFQQLVDGTPDGVYVFGSDHTHFDYVSQGAAIQTGYSSAELVTMTPLHIFATASPEWLTWLVRPLLAGDVEVVRTEQVLRQRTGSELPVEAQISYPVRTDGQRRLVAIVRDITERKLSEQGLAVATAEATLVGAAIDESDEAVAIFDLSTGEPVFRFVNERYGMAYGASRTEMIGKPVTDYPPIAEPGERAKLVASLAALGDGQVIRRHTTITGRDGTSLPVDVEAQALRVDSALVLVRWNDATDRLAAEAERRKVSEAEALAEERERVARDLHDTVVQQLFATGLSLQSAAGRATDDELAMRLNAAVDSIDSAIRQLRTAIFAGKGSRPLDDRASTYLTLVTIADEAGRMFATPPSVSIDRAVDDDRWRPIHQDLIAALRECLSNVARHARAGSVSVSIACTDDRLELTVDDDGIGVSADRSRAGNGLANLAARSGRHGGTFVLEPLPRIGTRARWVVPAPYRTVA
jgi:PAS domain S-box-containing protein